MIRAGDLRHRVTIQRKLDGATDAAGSDTFTWATVATVWAQVTPTGGSEVQQGDRTVIRNTYEVRIRKYPSLTAANRLTYGTQTLAIDLVRDVDGLGEEYLLNCIEQR